LCESWLTAGPIFGVKIITVWSGSAQSCWTTSNSEKQKSPLISEEKLFYHVALACETYVDTTICVTTNV